MLAAAAVVATPGAFAGKGGSDACAEWGNTPPGQLTTGHARKATLCLLNAERADAGRKPLKRNLKLQNAAQRHNDEMIGTGCFDHECPGELDLGDRLDEIGYLIGGLSRWAFGENIAWGWGGEGTPRSVMGAWMKSPGHRANILNPEFREVGIGFRSGTPEDGGDPGGVYTTDFGRRVR